MFLCCSRFHTLYLLLNLFVVNVPFLIIRILFKLQDEAAPISIMIIKNAILIAASSREFFHVHVARFKTGPCVDSLGGEAKPHPDDCEKGGGAESNGGATNGSVASNNNREGGTIGAVTNGGVALNSVKPIGEFGTNGAATHGGVELNSVKPIRERDFDVEPGKK